MMAHDHVLIHKAEKEDQELLVYVLSYSLAHEVLAPICSILSTPRDPLAISMLPSFCEVWNQLAAAQHVGGIDKSKGVLMHDR
jgi:hypothetical protein